ncbi:multidrug/spermidine efflux SMR transporter subunit MdtI [Thorsellia kenyensis]|uniref:Spermidine export protein MdtI n=1 Tax=Thorsellia kenyensis TaxID=1549888 RepID=A0ABV6CD68_9GAMM
MANVEFVHVVWLCFAIGLEITANICLKYADGFKRLGFGILSLLGVLGAFLALSQAVKGFDLSIAYALWGGFGIIATVAAGWIMFGQKLNKQGWLGLTLLISGMVIIKFA